MKPRMPWLLRIQIFLAVIYFPFMGLMFWMMYPGEVEYRIDDEPIIIDGVPYTREQIREVKEEVFADLISHIREIVSDGVGLGFIAYLFWTGKPWSRHVAVAATLIYVVITIIQDPSSVWPVLILSLFLIWYLYKKKSVVEYYRYLQEQAHGAQERT